MGSQVGSFLGAMRVSPRDQFYWYEDFLSTDLSSTSVAGTGAIEIGGGNTQADAGRPGVLGLYVTATATPDRASTHPNATNFASVRFQGGRWVIEGPVYFTNVSDGTDNFSFRWGFGDVVNADFVDGAYFEHDRQTHGDNNWRLVAASNSVRTKTNSGVAPVAATWYRLRIEVNDNATQVDYYVDDTLLGSVTTNIPTGATRLTHVMAQLIKTLGATVRRVHLDYLEVTQYLTTRR